MRYNPFNPQMPPRPENFVGRESELEKFEYNLLQTIHGSPLNMSITGNRGMGKTAILVKMEQIAKKNRCLVFRVSNYESLIENVTDLTNYLILGLKNEYIATMSVNSKIMQFGEWASTLKPIITYKDATLSFEEKTITAQTILRNNFSAFWEKVKNEYSAVIILVDEAESLDRVNGALSFLREVFQRLSHNSKYMVVLAGKFNFAERMSESFSPLNRSFPIFPLTPFNESETNTYITKMLSSVDVTIHSEVIKKIQEKSEGHPYVVVEMSSLVFNSLQDNEQTITMKHFENAYPKIIFELEKDFFNPMFHPVSPKAKAILLKLVKINKKRFLFKEAVKLTGIERKNIAPYIQELVRKGCLNKPERATYEFFHKLFIDFLEKHAISSEE